VFKNKTRGGGVLIALSLRFRSYKRRYDLESYDECVLVEIPILGSPNFLTGNHHFPPDTKSEVSVNYSYLRFLENKLDTHNFRVIMAGDFNTHGFDWNRGFSVPDCHYYSKLKGDAVYTSTCLLNLHQCIDAVGSSNLLDLIFSNFSDIGITFLDSGYLSPSFGY
jgi:hypothetical protein